jgi:hypothetical protein
MNEAGDTRFASEKQRAASSLFSTECGASSQILQLAAAG